MFQCLNFYWTWCAVYMTKRNRDFMWCFNTCPGMSREDHILWILKIRTPRDSALSINKQSNDNKWFQSNFPMFTSNVLLAFESIDLHVTMCLLVIPGDFCSWNHIFLTILRKLEEPPKQECSKSDSYAVMLQHKHCSAATGVEMLELK